MVTLRKTSVTIEYVLILIAALGTAKNVVNGLVELYMENHCRTHFYQYLLDNDRVYIDKSVILSLSNKPKGDTKMTCVATFAAKDSKHRMMIHFESLDINYNMGTTDRLHIYEGFDAGTELTPRSGLYGKYAKGVYEFSSGSIHDYLSQGQALSLYFIGTPSERFSGFRAILTVFQDPHVNGSCDPGYFRCIPNGYCISNDLVCNGYPNCGDNDISDEDQCNNGKSAARHYDMQDLGVLIGCGIAIIILLGVVLWMGILCIKKASLRRRQYREWLSACRQRPDPPPDTSRFFWPRWAYMEPPPLYSENVTDVQPPPIQPFELPPPYSVEEHDQATLIINEAPELPLVHTSAPTLALAEQRQAGSNNRRSRSNPQRSRHTRRASRGVRPTGPTSHQHRHSSSRRQRHNSGRDCPTSIAVIKNDGTEAKVDNIERDNSAANVNVTVVEVGIASQGHRLVARSSSRQASLEGATQEQPSSPTLSIPQTVDSPILSEALNMDCVKSSDEGTQEMKSDAVIPEPCGESVA